MKKIENTSDVNFLDDELRNAWLSNLGKVGKPFSDYSGARLFVNEGKLIAAPVVSKDNKKLLFRLGGLPLGLLGVLAAGAISEKIFKEDEVDAVEVLYWDLSNAEVKCWEEKFAGEYDTYFSVTGKCRLSGFEKTCEITFKQAGCANSHGFFNSKNPFYEETCALLGIIPSRSLAEMKQDMYGNRRPVKSLLDRLF